MMPIEELRGMLVAAFPEGEVDLSSPMNDDNHFQLKIVSPDFQGKSMVEQHQMVYKALGDSMREAVHALAIKTYTPEQWANQGGGR